MLLSCLNNDGEKREMNRMIFLKVLEDCERIEEMIIKGCERVTVKVLLRGINHE